MKFIVSHPHALGGARRIPDLVSALGQSNFGAELMAVLNGVCGASHCALYRFDHQRLSEITAASCDGTDTAMRQSSQYVASSSWVRDLQMVTALRAVSPGTLVLQRTDTRGIIDEEFRCRFFASTKVQERILLWGGSPERAVGLSIMRSEDQGAASDSEMCELSTYSDTLLALLNKHAILISKKPNFQLPLSSISDARNVIARCEEGLTAREIEVCALIICGISTAGIASTLGIGEETVTTYRKRAYSRLEIGTQRELMIWFADQWALQSASRWNHDPEDAPMIGLH